MNALISFPLWASCALAIIPGGLPHDFSKGDPMSITAEKMSSMNSPVSYDFYYLPFCKPTADWSQMFTKRGMNLGQILKGDTFEITAMETHMMVSNECTTSCTAAFQEGDVDRMLDLINSQYEVSLSIDDLPAALALTKQDEDKMKDLHYHENHESADKVLHVSGYPLGQALDDNKSSIANHLALKVFYWHGTEGRYSTRDTYRVVGFEVTPMSIESCASIKNGESVPFTVTRGSPANIPFSYSVQYIESDIPWVTRWDNYLQASQLETEIHWISLLDGFLIALTLGLMCGLVLLRTVHQDIARYNNLEDFDEINAESGWKLLYGDVFRRPWGSRALAGFVGSGIQVIGAATTVIVGGAIGILSPANRGSIGQASICLFTLFGIPAGYVCARLNRVYLQNDVSNDRSLIVTAVTAVVFPGVAFNLYLLANFLIFVKGGASIPFSTVIVLGFLWFFISIPLTIAGAYLGYRAEPIDLPCRVNRLPRQVPGTPKYKNALVLAFSAGIPIISVAITEIRSVLVSMVFHHFYYLIGYVVISFVLMLITASLISVVITYMILVTEEWRWWWPAFWSGASAGIYAFILGFSLVGSISNGGVVDTLINTCYLAIWTMTLGLMLGSVGLLTSFFFIISIFKSIKLD